MRRRIVTLGVWAAPVLALVHAGLTLAYLLPDNPLTFSVDSLVSGYMEPWFQQDWRLFSPTPPVGFDRLWGRCRMDQERWTPWFDPATPLQRTHEVFRISGHGKQLRQVRSVGEELLQEYSIAVKECESAPSESVEPLCATQRELQSRVLSSAPGKRARDLMTLACSSRFGVQPAALELKLMKFVVAPWSKRGSGEHPKLVGESTLVWEGVR